MTDATPAELQQLIAAEFDRRRWEYDLTIGRQLVAEIERRGAIDARGLVQKIPTEFLHRNHTNRDTVAAALERAIGGLTPKRDPAFASLVINDNRYQVNISGGSKIENSKLNVGEGTQINVDVHASRDDVLTAVEAILRAGLAEEWNADAARDLANVIDARDDVDFEDVRAITTEVIDAEKPPRGRVKALLEKIALSGLGGALATGISAGAGEVISQLPL